MKKINFYQDEFDTDVLGRRVAKLDLLEEVDDANFSISKFDDFVVENDISFVSCKTIFAKKNLDFLMTNNFYLVSTRVLYYLEKLPENTNQNHSDKSLKIIDGSDFQFDENNKDFLHLVDVIAPKSHYGCDSNLSPNVSVNLYKKIFANAFDGYADRIFVAICDGMLVGLVTLKLYDEKVFIREIVVSRNFQGRKIGKELIGKAIEYACERGLKLNVWTQVENIAANKFYQRNGFVMNCFELVYHKIF